MTAGIGPTLQLHTTTWKYGIPYGRLHSAT